MTHRLEQTFLETLSRYRLLENTSKVLVALSGGADSVLLLRLLYQLSQDSLMTIAACHVNHNIRGESAIADARFSEGLCAQLNISFLLKNINVKEYSQSNGLSMEDAARTLRYEALEKAAEECSADAIATAHHSDDLAETMLFRLFKGTGVSGLASISLQRPSGKAGIKIIRPLLFLGRNDIVDYLKINNQDFVTDESNTSLEYDRNYIRHVIIPLVEKRFPAFRDKMSSHYSIVLDEEAHWTSHISQLESIIHINPDYLALSKDDLLQIGDISVQRRLIRHVILKKLGSHYNPPLITVNRIIQSIQERKGNKILFRNEALEVDSAYSEILFRIPAKSFPKSIKYVKLSVRGLIHWGRYSIRFDADSPVHQAEQSGTDEPKVIRCFFNRNGLDEIIVRERRDGDRLNIGPEKTKKIKDFFIDSKFSLVQRENALIIESPEKEILAVFVPGFGFRVSTKFYYDNKPGQTRGSITIS